MELLERFQVQSVPGVIAQVVAHSLEGQPTDALEMLLILRRKLTLHKFWASRANLKKQCCMWFIEYTSFARMWKMCKCEVTDGGYWWVTV